MNYKVGDRVKILLKYPTDYQCSGCGSGGCPYHNKIGVIKELNYNGGTNVWVTEMKRNDRSLNGGCSGFLLTDIEPEIPPKITNWRGEFTK